MLSNSIILLILSLQSACLAHVHHHSARKIHGQNWYHPSDHDVHQLFGRQASTTNSKAEVFPKVGSKEWKALFPVPFETLTKDAAKPAWIDALNEVKAQGLIPTNVPIGKFNETSGYPEYNGGQLDPKGDVVCSASYFCRGPDDVWDAPEGHVGISFDDGPLPDSSPLLNSFLKSQNQTATHFLIGSNILQNPDLFLEAFEDGHDMACHTWSHPYMTTISDEAVVAELGWLLEIVRVSSGGRIPRYWRPPYGDVDNRVRAIAKHVFGLTTVIWNHDSLDWELPEGPVTSAGVHQNYTTWYSGPKAPGLVILSHELTTQSVQAFIDTYPLIAQNGWIAKSIPDLFGGGPRPGYSGLEWICRRDGKSRVYNPLDLHQYCHRWENGADNRVSDFNGEFDSNCEWR